MQTVTHNEAQCRTVAIRDIEPAFRINGRNRHVVSPSFKSHENPQGATEHCCQAGADNEGRRVGFHVFEFLRVSFALFSQNSIRKKHGSISVSVLRTLILLGGSIRSASFRLSSSHTRSVYHTSDLLSL